MNKKIGYKELINHLDDDDKESLQKVFCEDSVSISTLAQEYETSSAVMRRVIMEIFGEVGYEIAKNQRKAKQKKFKNLRSYPSKHLNSRVLYKVLYYLQETSLNYYQISKKVNCSRERVGQIAKECLENNISLNMERAEKMNDSRYYKTRMVRGYIKTTEDKTTFVKPNAV